MSVPSVKGESCCAFCKKPLSVSCHSSVTTLKCQEVSQEVIKTTIQITAEMNNNRVESMGVGKKQYHAEHECDTCKELFDRSVSVVNFNSASELKKLSRAKSESIYSGWGH